LPATAARLEMRPFYFLRTAAKVNSVLTQLFQISSLRNS